MTTVTGETCSGQSVRVLLHGMTCTLDLLTLKQRSDQKTVSSMITRLNSLLILRRRTETATRSIDDMHTRTILADAYSMNNPQWLYMRANSRLQHLTSTLSGGSGSPVSAGNSLRLLVTPGPGATNVCTDTLCSARQNSRKENQTQWRKEAPRIHNTRQAKYGL